VLAATMTIAVLSLGVACRVTSPQALELVDGEAVHGDGLPERVIVDAWVFGSAPSGQPHIDAAQQDLTAPPPSDGATSSGADSGPSLGCSLLDGDCPANQGCFADDALSGATSCQPATPGFGLGSRFPCQAQTDCSPGEVCINLKGTGRICLALCRTDIAGGNCVDINSVACVPLASYPGAGYCS
jgi:hypothetical protein